MALNGTPVIIPGKGTVFTGPPHAAIPTKASLDPALTSTYTGMECLGHTSRDNGVALTKEGGDATNLGSWWDPNLVSNRDAVSWSGTVNSLQVDYPTLSLAFPGGRVTTGGLYAIPSGSSSIERSVYILCVDGSKRLGIYCPRVSISLGEAPSISTDSFFEVQLAMSMLSATQAVGTDVAIGDLILFDVPGGLVVPAPIVSAVTPPTATAGTTMTIKGDYFTGATDVKFGAVSATGIQVQDRSTIQCIMPAGAAGSAAVTVITPAGTSNSFPYTRGA